MSQINTSEQLWFEVETLCADQDYFVVEFGGNSLFCGLYIIYISIIHRP